MSCRDYEGVMQSYAHPFKCYSKFEHLIITTFAASRPLETTYYIFYSGTG